MNREAGERIREFWGHPLEEPAGSQFVILVARIYLVVGGVVCSYWLLKTSGKVIRPAVLKLGFGAELVVGLFWSFLGFGLLLLLIAAIAVSFERN